MFAPFFTLAAQSPSRQRTFRQTAVARLAVLSVAAGMLFWDGPKGATSAALLGHLLLITGIVEGATLLGWRLTQMPKSQALEFLLVSPLRPRWLFVVEASVGLAVLGCLTLAGLPVLLILVACGCLDPLDTVPLLVMPFTWGAITGLALAVWAYEPLRVRRAGERVLLGLVLFYLVVGVLAGENLGDWLGVVPDGVRACVLQGLAALHAYNPFAVLGYWLENDLDAAWPRAAGVQAAAALLLGGLLWRAARRLHAHFHELHYTPARDVSAEARPPVGERPLRWRAVKRVARYSGRINLWLAGGFGALYALYLVAGHRWPQWLGRGAFQLCDEVGGAAALATGLVVLAAVPAAFQYGLWDSNAQDRCRRLELLLLTRLRARDYWEAAAAAAWARGRGYFAVAVLLWSAAAVGGRMTAAQALLAAAVGVLLWTLYFALGFRSFSRGHQATGLGTLLTAGLPLLAICLHNLGWPLPGALLPPGAVYDAAASSVHPSGPALFAVASLLVGRRALRRCDAELRRWYEAHHGRKVMS